ncbi:cupin domain-containing protein [Nocardia uniformis]|uniref:cupin domain-containing protein n=1 Tax=Nocardia uniformis TaxID=53432 RepID=UPI001FDF253B|nr:cupin domain-containing protein [Nocardia uniformis]
MAFFRRDPQRGYRPNPAPATGTASRVLIRFTVAGREFVLRRTVIEPGGQSGWHYHDGTLWVLVTGGDLDHPWTDCVPLTHRRGRIFREPGGRAHAHLARNLGATPVKLTVLYIKPAGSPLARGIDPPPCAR